MAADLEYVAEPFGRDESRPGKFILEHRVGDDRRPVNEEGNAFRCRAGGFEAAFQPIKQRAARIAAPARHLGDRDVDLTLHRERKRP